MSLAAISDQLPSISDARLPRTYEAATRALAECSRIDECMEWADKAQALASYAKQAKDDQLRKMADRIQARAINRCGELLKQIPQANGANQNIRDGADLKVTRSLAAGQAGLSERQKKTALRVASVPRHEFERQIESDDPPTVTELARQGTKARLVDLGDIPPQDFASATQAQGTLKRFAEFCDTHDPQRIARAYKRHEVAALRGYVASIDSWMDRFVINLSE